MQQYTDFSSVYDIFMDNVPYEEWAGKIANRLKEYGIEDGLVLDLGCGTGTLTEMLSDLGYDMIGIDSSEDMLAEAREKLYEYEDEIDEDDDIEGVGDPEANDDYEASDDFETADDFEVSDELETSDEAYDINEIEQILYLCQDISDFELYGTVRAVVSTCDTFNYLTDRDALLASFKLVNNYIEPDGIFIFDMNAPEKYEQVLADNVFAENREDASFIWENSYDKESKINEYALTLFIKDEETDQYEKTEECHYQRAYSREEIKELLDEAGFEILDNYEEDMRMFYVAKVAEGRKLGNIG